MDDGGGGGHSADPALPGLLDGEAELAGADGGASSDALLAAGFLGVSEGYPEQVLAPFDAYPAAAQQGVVPSVYPWSAVALVLATFPNGVAFAGSGVMVGRNDVLTAGHIVYEPAWGGFASSVTVVPAFAPESGLNGPYGFSPATITAADTEFDPDGDRLIVAGNGGPGLVGSERDVAFLTLQTPLGDLTGWMGLDPAFTQGYATLSGYPAVYGFHQTDDVAWAFVDRLDSFINTTWFEAHPGNSGGPVWHYGSDGNPAVVGLLSSGAGDHGVAAFDIATSYDSILGWMASNDYLLA